jgi:hypothetical protein
LYKECVDEKIVYLQKGAWRGGVKRGVVVMVINMKATKGGSTLSTEPLPWHTLISDCYSARPIYSHSMPLSVPAFLL